MWNPQFGGALDDDLSRYGHEASHIFYLEIYGQSLLHFINIVLFFQN